MAISKIGSYLQAKGHEVKSKAGQDVTTCPFCSDERPKFYIDPEKNLYHCKLCEAKGNEITLKKHFQDTDNPILTRFKSIIGSKKTIAVEQDLADQYNQNLYKNAKAYSYLIERGLKPETIRHFNLGFMHDNTGDWIAIPYYQAGKLVNFKFRSLPPQKKTFKRLPDAPSALFNADALTNETEAIITEGEFDAIMCWQFGLKNVVSGINGCSSFEPEWIDLLQDKEKIYLWYDNDEPGRKSSDELGKRLGEYRCYFIREDGFKDANEFFMCNDFYDLCNAEQKPVKNIELWSDSIEKIFSYTIATQSEITTPWSDINELIGGIEKGDLITLSATPKTGKTTWALNVALHNAKKEHPVLFYCLEMRPEKIVKKIIKCEGRLTDSELTQDTVYPIANKLAYMPLYNGYHYKQEEITKENIFDTIRTATKRFGLKLIVFDNLHYLVRTSSNVTAEVGVVVRGFKLLAEELEVPIILIAQPRKVDDGMIMTMNDLKDSSSIGADSDQVIIMHRKKTQSDMNQDNTQSSALEPETLIRVDASRYSSGGDKMLYYHGDKSRFEQMTRRP